jgi:hypothetical protein
MFKSEIADIITTVSGNILRTQIEDVDKFGDCRVYVIIDRTCSAVVMESIKFRVEQELRKAGPLTVKWIVRMEYEEIEAVTRYEDLPKIQFSKRERMAWLNPIVPPPPEPPPSAAYMKLSEEGKVSFDSLLKTATEMLEKSKEDAIDLVTASAYAAGIITADEARAQFGLPDVPVPAPRTRFSAVVEELTVEIAPLKKPTPTTEPARPRAPRVFEPTIRVINKQLSACPACGCTAFTMNETKSSVWCRGCKSTPVYALEFVDKSIPDSAMYICNGCRTQARVTMTMSELNLWCWKRCIPARATLHSIVPEFGNKFPAGLYWKG